MSARVLLLVAAFLGFSSATPLRAESAAPPSTTAAAPKELRDVPYVTNGHARQKLDLYLPTKGDAPHPALVWIHGGGWQGGTKDKCPGTGMVARGYVVASIEYRLSQDAKFPAQIEDCKSAIRWLRAHASDYGIDPERIAVWGASAGGHLVALLGTTRQTRVFDTGENLNQSSSVQCVIDWFGPTDFVHWAESGTGTLNKPDSAVSRLLGAPPAEKPELAQRASPITYVSSDAAPFIIIHGDEDPLVPLQQSQLLDEALRKNSVESTLIVLKGAKHGGPEFTTPEELQRLLEFIERHIGSGGPVGK